MMTTRMTRNLYAVFFVVAWVYLMILLSGCTIYKVHSEPGKTIDVSVWSSRSFVAPTLTYKRTGGDADFHFGADQATQPAPQDYAAGVAAGIRAMLIPPVPQ